MPAEIANIAGEAFASFREPAWHGLGTVFDSEVTDYQEMLKLAHLDYSVTLREIETDARALVPGFEVLRDSDEGLIRLGIVGGRYEIVQNAEAFAFLQSLHDGARWETGGALKGGAVAFGSMAFQRDFTIDPEGVADVVKSYLLVATSHDGSTGVQGGVTPVRVVCQNTLNMALGNLSNTFKIRHTRNVADRMKAEAELWRHANTYMDAFEAEAKTLYAAPVTDKQYQSVLADLFPKPEKDVKGAVTKWEKRIERFTQPWKTEANAGIRGTAWGVMQALTEADQWSRSTRGKGEDGQPSEAAMENFFSAGAGFDGPTNAFRNKARTIALSLAK